MASARAATVCATILLPVVESWGTPPKPPPPSITLTWPEEWIATPEELLGRPLPPSEELLTYLWYAIGTVLVLYVVRFLWHPHVPRVRVLLEDDEKADVLLGPEPMPEHSGDTAIPCRDPSTGRLLGTAKALSEAEVSACVSRARAAQTAWAASSFAQRRKLLRILSRCTLDHAEDICRISARDSGKTTTDAAFGEVLVTLEKLNWLCTEGEACLKPEYRSAGRMLFYKRARVEFHPRGVVGAIVPWNYPFHNLLNPISAAVFAGNAIVIKVSEHAAWSARFYDRMIQACLAAAGAPADLVQLVHGYGAAGAALTREVSLMTFVGSTAVGKKVMEGAAKTLTPVVLELGGKDPFVLLPGTKLESVVQIAARAGWGAGGQNCIGAERFFVHSSQVEDFAKRMGEIASTMRQGPPLNADGNTGVDIGALCLPGEAERIKGLVDNAKLHGARVLAGGAPVAPAGGEGGQFFPPTLVIVPDLRANPPAAKMRLLQQEVFGPLITIVPYSTEDELLALVNGCPFALGSSVFGPSDREVARVGKRIQAGMLACNDFATCYMCQSLPMGGLKDSGFGKFAGVEGLRGLCLTKAVVEDIVPFIRTELPPPLRYPLSGAAFPFVRGLMHFFYGHSLSSKLSGVLALIQCSLFPASSAPPPCVPVVIRRFNTARLKGDGSGSAACCTDDVVFESPNECYYGLKEMREKVFATAAPPPAKEVQPMGPEAPDGLCAAQVGPGGSARSKVFKYSRVFEAKFVGEDGQAKLITLRQELYTRHELQPDGSLARAGPKICRIKMQLVP
jgi:acyl-CoA reductase-like NAD-dependent aldehyde dehydrogenase